MPISSPNSKRCFAKGLAAAGLAAMWAVSPLAHPAHAAVKSEKIEASPPALSKEQRLKAWIKSDLLSHQSPEFEPLLKKWSSRYGTDAVPVLTELARDRQVRDDARYKALMGAARLGGPVVAPKIVPLLKDPSWMIRSGSLRALSLLRNSETAAAVLPLLKDPALVVRLEAVSAIETLRPQGARSALQAAIDDPSNYLGGKKGSASSQWVPERARKALRKISR